MTSTGGCVCCSTSSSCLTSNCPVYHAVGMCDGQLSHPSSPVGPRLWCAVAFGVQPAPAEAAHTSLLSPLTALSGHSRIATTKPWHLGTLAARPRPPIATPDLTLSKFVGQPRFQPACALSPVRLRVEAMSSNLRWRVCTPAYGSSIRGFCVRARSHPHGHHRGGHG
jgi:hypothetical protein